MALQAQQMLKIREIQDEKDESAIERRIGEYEFESSRNLSKNLADGEIQQQEKLRKVDVEGDRTVQAVNDVTLADRERFEQAKRAIIAEGQLRKESEERKYDAAIEMAKMKLNESKMKIVKESLDLSKETREMEEKNEKIRVTQDQLIYDEVAEKRQFHERVAEKQREKLRELQKAAWDEELKSEEAARKHAQETANKLLAETHEDVKQRTQAGLLNIRLLQNSVDTKNRREINGKLAVVKEKPDQINEFYRTVYQVLTLTSEERAGLTKSKRKAALISMKEFIKALEFISQTLSDTERSLADLELDGVDKAEEIRAIKTKISEFSEVIAYLQIRIDLGSKEIDEAKINQFTNLKNDLLNMITGIAEIPVHRERMSATISSLLPPENSGKQGNLQIEN